MTSGSKLELSRVAVVAGVCGVAWALLSGVLAPWWIETGGIFEGDAKLQQRTLKLIQRLCIAGTCGALLSAIGLYFQGADARRDRPILPQFVGTATPTALGAIRVLTCGIALWLVLWEDLASIALLPPSLTRGMGVMMLLKSLPGVAGLFQSHSALLAFEWLTAALLALALVGYKTRVTLPLAAVAYLVFAGTLRMYTHFFHTGLMPLYLLTVLSLTPCGDGLSLDRWLRVRRGLPVPDAWTATLRYGWARYAVWGTLGITYFAAGIAKLRNGGWGWWDALNMRTKVVQESLQQTRFFDHQPGLVLKDGPDILFALMGLGTIVIEVGMIFVLVSPLARRVLPLLVASMHLGVLVLQKVLFIDAILVQLVFYDFSKWLRRTPRAEPSVASAAPSFARARPSLLSATVVVLLATYVGVIVGKVEFFPLTSWQMYSHRERQPVVTHYRAYVVGKDDSRRRFRLESCAGALFDARYVDVLRIPFKERAVQPVEEFFQRCASSGAGAVGDEGVAAYEVEKIVWNYESDATNPDHGRVEALRRFDVVD